MSEQKYRELYDDSPDMHLTARVERNAATIVDCNQTLCTRLGYRKDELIGQPFQIVYPAGYVTSAESTNEFQQTGEFADVERLLRTKDGRLIDVSLSLRAIRDEDGAIVGARAIWRDISKRKQVERDREFLVAELYAAKIEKAVRHQEERFRSLVVGLKEYAILMLDRDGNIVSWSEGGERLTGYRTDEIIGKSVALFHTAEDRATGYHHTTLAKARDAGRFAEEGWRVRKDGTRFWADVTLTPLFDPQGQIEGYAKITRDFTERHEQEEALRRSVREREVLLQEVHHRVKNNLQIISSLINMQVRRLEPGDTREALAETKHRVLAIALIHEKLYQSKNYAHVRFAEYVRSLAGNVFHAAGATEKQITLELEIEDMPLGIDRAIPCGLVVNELISNALKHGLANRDRGRVRVELRRTPVSKVCLTVSDDGAGLPPGFDIDRSTSMGLQLVCTLATQLEAVIEVRGGDSGASFQLTFPGEVDAS